MTEIRCVKCRRLLFKAEKWEGKIEIRCPKCGYTSDIEIEVKEGEYRSVKYLPSRYVKDCISDAVGLSEGGMRFQVEMAKETKVQIIR